MSKYVKEAKNFHTRTYFSYMTEHAVRLSQGLLFALLLEFVKPELQLLIQRRNHNKLSLNDPLFCWPQTMTGFYSEFWQQELSLSASSQTKR